MSSAFADIAAVATNHARARIERLSRETARRVLLSFAERGDVIQPGKVLMVLLLTRTDVEPGLGR